jgi:mono/diheme cytochrome c family protein
MTTPVIAPIGIALGLSLAAACAHRGDHPTPAAQAEAGEVTYRAACVACHMPDLSGSGDAPALVGEAFARAWNDRRVSDLIGFVRGHMPRTIPGALNDRSYLDVVAYVLVRNGAPMERVLTPDAGWTVHLGPPPGHGSTPGRR